jgi:hypothetical protein
MDEKEKLKAKEKAKRLKSFNEIILDEPFIIGGKY